MIYLSIYVAVCWVLALYVRFSPHVRKGEDGEFLHKASKVVLSNLCWPVILPAVIVHELFGTKKEAKP